MCGQRLSRSESAVSHFEAAASTERQRQQETHTELHGHLPSRLKVAEDERAVVVYEQNLLIKRFAKRERDVCEMHQQQLQPIQANSSDRSSRQRERREATVRAEESYEAALTYTVQE